MSEPAQPDAGATAPVGDAFGLTSRARVVSFERASGQIVRSMDLTLPPGETLLGGDVRPADRSAIVLSSAGKLSTLDLTPVRTKASNSA